jgi:hypothetical protein
MSFDFKIRPKKADFFFLRSKNLTLISLLTNLLNCMSVRESTYEREVFADKKV